MILTNMNLDFSSSTNSSSQLCCHAWQDKVMTPTKSTQTSQVLILDIVSLIFKQDSQHVFRFWHRQCLDEQMAANSAFSDNVNEVTNDKHQLTTAGQLMDGSAAQTSQESTTQLIATAVITKGMEPMLKLLWMPTSSFSTLETQGWVKRVMQGLSRAAPSFASG